MIRLLHRLRSDARGVGIIEFALAAPVLLLMIVAASQLGVLFMSNAGLKHAVAEGARYATIHPRPNDAEIRARIDARRFGLKPQSMSTPAIVTGKADGADYLEISVTYDVALNFVFFKPAPVQLKQTRRVFIYPTY